MEKYILRNRHWFRKYFVDKGLDYDLASTLNIIIVAILFILTMYLLDFLLKKLIVWFYKIATSKTKNKFTNYLARSDFPKYIAHIITLYTIGYFVPKLFKGNISNSGIIMKLINVAAIVLCIYIIRSVLHAIIAYLRSKEKYKDKPLESYLQVLMIFTWGIGIFFIINTFTGFSAFSVASLSAVSAIVLLFFRDTILGFVSSVQITVNNMVRIGDWITLKKDNANGIVTEINLTTVRVQNFDKTFILIPTYSLTSSSFQNWRGMLESDGRKIKRAIYIKQSTIKFLTDSDIEKYKKIELITTFIEDKKKNNDTFNTDNKIDKTLLINGKNQTNIGIFRKYIDSYLKNNPAINKNMSLGVKYLAPTAKGLPVEVNCFSKDKNSENFQHIQAAIFSHLIASAPYFDLEIFEDQNEDDSSEN